MELVRTHGCARETSVWRQFLTRSRAPPPCRTTPWVDLIMAVFRVRTFDICSISHPHEVAVADFGFGALARRVGGLAGEHRRGRWCVVVGMSWWGKTTLAVDSLMNGSDQIYLPPSTRTPHDRRSTDEWVSVSMRYFRSQPLE